VGGLKETPKAVKSSSSDAAAEAAAGGGGGGDGFSGYSKRGNYLRGICGAGTGVTAATRAQHGAQQLDSKFKVLLKELALVRSQDPTAKSLVFSQFTQTIEALKPRLLAAGFQWRSLSGSMTLKHRAAALEEFQSDPPTTIFLLSIRAGACGINLTQANQVRQEPTSPHLSQQ
jgi:SNF2 family DNA or RNA helicase